MSEPTMDDVKKLVGRALARLSEKDNQLFEKNVNERSITHKLAEYLQQEFPDWNVDCEYNRNLDEIKRLRLPRNGVGWDDLESKSVFPDIIVHKRGTTKNLLAIEVKKSNSSVGDGSDKRKLQAFGRAPFNYKFGLFIKFDVQRGGRTQVHWFSYSPSSTLST